MLEEGIGDDRRVGRFPRVHHGLSRVVAIGNDGVVSLAALQWLADQKIALSMLERDGVVLCSIGPIAASDTRLRRAQACLSHSPSAVLIVRELIRQKIAGQESVVRNKLNKTSAAHVIARFRNQLMTADSIDTIRMIEGHAAGVYWTAWQDVAIRFPKSDLPKIPEHWTQFSTRRSPISGTSRRSPNPVNAILNYLYTLLESETRLAITALGLDPGFGLLHVDQSTRDSLVYDLMEPIRPKIDAYVLDWILRTPLKRSWFFEERDGCCRLMSDMTASLADTTRTWAEEVAPIVEWFAQSLASSAQESTRVRTPATRLTQRSRCEGQGVSAPAAKEPKTQPNVCTICGTAVSPNNRYCHECGQQESGKRLAAAQAMSLDAARTPEALEKKSAAMKDHRNALRNWQPSDLPEWLTDEVYIAKIQLALERFSKAEIARALGISKDYVYEIVRGDKVPHKRHWVKLAELVGMSSEEGSKRR